MSHVNAKMRLLYYPVQLPPHCYKKNYRLRDLYYITTSYKKQHTYVRWVDWTWPTIESNNRPLEYFSRLNNKVHILTFSLLLPRYSPSIFFIALQTLAMSQYCRKAYWGAPFTFFISISCRGWMRQTCITIMISIFSFS